GGGHAPGQHDGGDGRQAAGLHGEKESAHVGRPDPVAHALGPARERRWRAGGRGRMTAVEAFNSWGAAWASFMARSLVDVSALLALLLIAWLPFRRRFSAQLGYGLFCLVLLKLFLPVPASWHRAIPVRQVVEGLAGWDRSKVAPSLRPTPFLLP